MSATANVMLKITANLAASLDMEEVASVLTKDLTKAFANGSGADKISKVFSDQRTLSASSSEELDLAASLIDGLGNTITFTKVKALIVRALAANTNNVEVGGSGANGFEDWVGATGDLVSVKPGGVFLITAPDANGLTVTAGTADLLKIANSAGSTSVTYDIIILGE